jgi:hypothetical protein
LDLICLDFEKGSGQVADILRRQIIVFYYFLFRRSVEVGSCEECGFLFTSVNKRVEICLLSGCHWNVSTLWTVTVLIGDKVHLVGLSVGGHILEASLHCQIVINQLGFFLSGASVAGGKAGEEREREISLFVTGCTSFEAFFVLTQICIHLGAHHRSRTSQR